ncbi:replication endonuclease [Klebsiella quasipneumoniae]|uniref:replication endonuclease n=1 Tax=Klebsiella quasipneumoniae TaxID=1463165 RepID=UPI003983C27A
MRWYSVRVAEPYHDGIVHWRLLCFLRKNIAIYQWVTTKALKTPLKTTLSPLGVLSITVRAAPNRTKNYREKRRCQLIKARPTTVQRQNFR